MKRRLAENCRGPRGAGARRRRGMAVLMVLLLLTATLGLSYAMVRSQNMAAMIERNADRRALARQAALAGMSVALRRIHRNTWGGVGAGPAQRISTYERYAVTYEPGDPALAATHDYYPYRVTIVSTGYSQDPGDSQRVAEHTVRAVLELVPTRLADTPAGWGKVCQSTLLQYSRTGSFTADVTFRIAGRTEICSSNFDVTSYNWPDNVRDRYFSDLEAMRAAGKPDWRPFNGPVYLYDIPDDETSENLVRRLGINFSMTTSSYASLAGDAGSSYRIYENGPQYSMDPLNSSTLRAWTYDPNVQNNPLRLIRRSGSVTLNENVAIGGTLVVTTSLSVAGANVRLTPRDLPKLQGQTRSLRLPTAIIGDDLQIENSASGELTGVFNVTDRFAIPGGSQDSLAGLAIRVRLVANNVEIGRRSEWNQSSSWWNLVYNLFGLQKDDAQGTPYLPEFLRLWTVWPRLQPEPRIVIAPPDESTIVNHWNADPAGTPTCLQDGIYRFQDDTSVPDGRGHAWQMVQWLDGA